MPARSRHEIAIRRRLETVTAKIQDLEAQLSRCQKERLLLEAILTEAEENGGADGPAAS